LANTLFDRILTRLLKDERYDTMLLEASPTALNNELLHGVDVLLPATHPDTDLRGLFLKSMRSMPEAAQQRKPMLSLSPTLASLPAGSHLHNLLPQRLLPAAAKPIVWHRHTR
jgi:hypothetical protein